MFQAKAKKPAVEDPTKPSLYEGQRRATLARARQEELKLARIQGELVRRDAVEKAQFENGRRVRDNIENLPARTSGILATMTDQAQIFAYLSQELRQCLERVTQ